MYRVSVVGTQILAVSIKNVEEAAGDIKELIFDGTPVIIVQDLEDLEALAITPDDVEVL